MRDITFAPAYVALYPLLAEIAREHGYSLTIHGSVGNQKLSDLDLVAIPWIETAKSDIELLAAIYEYTVNVISHYWEGENTETWVATEKPHGRRAWKLQLGNGSALDISIMPRLNHA